MFLWRQFDDVIGAVFALSGAKANAFLVVDLEFLARSLLPGASLRERDVIVAGPRLIGGVISAADQLLECYCTLSQSAAEPQAFYFVDSGPRIFGM